MHSEVLRALLVFILTSLSIRTLPLICILELCSPVAAAQHPWEAWKEGCSHRAFWDSPTAQHPSCFWSSVAGAFCNGGFSRPWTWWGKIKSDGQTCPLEQLKSKRLETASDGEKLELFYITGGNVKGLALSENSLAVPHEVNQTFTTCSSIPTP